MMSGLRILLLEDNANDAELIQEVLQADHLVREIIRVQSRPDFEAALQIIGIDLILADYKLPAFDGLSALEVALRQRPEVPFILVSGTLGEEMAVEALKSGATDYVLKTRLSRLVPAVRRASREAIERAERRHAEQALRRSEMYLAEAERLSHTGSFGWNLSSGEIYWSHETYRIFQLDGVITPTWQVVIERTHPDDRMTVQKVIDCAMSERKSFTVEHRLLMADASIKHVRVVAHGVSGPDPDSFRFVGAVMDITERKRTEQTLRELYHELVEREAKIRRLVDANIIGIMIFDLDGKIIEANDAFLRIVGYDREDLVAGRLRWTDLTPPEWLDRDLRLWIPEQKVTGHLPPFEKEYFRKDGSRVPVLIGVASFEGGGNEGVAFVLDLTERKQAEEAVRESERRYREVQAEFAHAARISMLGELTASLAHELKQPLAAITMSNRAGQHWLDLQVPNVAEARAASRNIETAVQRCTDVLDRIRGMATRRAPERARVSFDELIDEALMFLRSELQSCGITVSRQLAPGAPNVLADRIQFQQVIVNLVVNAMQAMAQAGSPEHEITIRTTMPDATTLSCSVEDSGPGIALEHQDRLFESFFTTKENGMGMGLPICRSIIEAHGGRLWASANLPSGAVFQFTVPLYPDA